MFKIAICDDEKYFAEEMEKYILKYSKENNFKCKVDIFLSSKEFIQIGLRINSYEIIFLDINMEELDGIQVAQEIRTFNKEVAIVFITAFVTYSLEGYKVNASRYILKDNKNLEEYVFEAINSALEDINYKNAKKTFGFIEGKKVLNVDKIIYIESNLHKLIFHISEKTLTLYTMRAKLNEIEKKLKGNNFIRIHQSFHVNLRYIKSVSNYSVILKGGTKLPIPKARYKEVKNKIVEYKGEI